MEEIQGYYQNNKNKNHWQLLHLWVGQAKI